MPDRIVTDMNGRKYVTYEPPAPEVAAITAIDNEIEQEIYQRTREFVSSKVQDAIAELIAAEREECERLKHAMREAMRLLDQPEPRPHAAFSELLLALNPDLPSAIRKRGESK